MDSTVLIRLSAFFCAAGGVWVLQAAWKAHNGNGQRLALGWSLIFGSVIAWAFTSGADKGAALGIIAVILLVMSAFLLTALKTEKSAPRRITPRTITGEKVGIRTILSRVWAGLLIGPISGLASLSICTAAFAGFKMAGLEHTANLTIVSFSFPLLWACLGIFAGYETRMLVKSGTVLASGLVPLAFMALQA
ncbi:MAG: hypothetical protein AAGH42_07485 [Pseudomonadota bacterium]